MFNNYNSPEPINVGNTGEHSIKKISEIISNHFNFNNEIIWDTSVPNGQDRKPSDNSKFIKLGWDNNRYTDFEISLKNTCNWFVENYKNVRGVK